MPYDAIADLPDRVKEQFTTTEERRAFMSAFNAAWDGICKDGGRQGNREGCSMAIATEAAKGVKKELRKQEEEGSIRTMLSGMKAMLDKLLASSGAMHGHVEGTAHDMTDEGSTSVTVSIAKSGQVVKSDDELQILYMPALVPDVEDSQGDIVSKEDVREAAHHFMAEYPLNKDEMGIGVDHASRTPLPYDTARLVESWVEKFDQDYDGKKIPEGTWMIGVHIPDKEIWLSAKKGERTGASIEGKGVRTPA